MQEKINNNNNEITTIKPLEETKIVENLEGYVKDVEFLELQDFTASSIGKILHLIGGDFIISHDNELSYFDKNGLFQSNILNRGRSNSEYISINDIALTEDKSHLIVLDDAKLLFVNLSNFKDVVTLKLPLKYPVDAIAPASSNDVYLYSWMPVVNNSSAKGNQYLVAKINVNGEVLGRYIEKTDLTFSINNISCSADNIYYLRPQDSNHIFYKLDKNGVTPICKVDFQSKNIPARYYYNQTDENMMEYITSPYFKFPTNLLVASDMFSFKASDESSEWNYLYSTRKKSGISWKSSRKDPNINFITSDTKGYFYTVVDAAFLKIYDKNLQNEYSPLYNLIIKQFSNEKYDLASENSSYIVKIKFM